MNNNALLRLQVRLQQTWINVRDNERGQTMVEYAGIGLIVAALIVAVVGAVGGGAGDIGEAITKKIAQAIKNLHS